MKQNDRHLWPFTPKVSIICSILLLLSLLIISSILRKLSGWPDANSTNVVLIGILLVSLLPIVLALLDLIIERGARIEYHGVKIDFSDFSQRGVSDASDIVITENIGVEGQSIQTSGESQILGALKKATRNDIVVINLKEGQSWWETRLFVLAAGAERLGKPDKMVFLGTEGGKEKCFEGWAYSKDILHCLTSSNPEYNRILVMARVAANRWKTVEPLEPIPPNTVAAVPPFPADIISGLAYKYMGSAFDYGTGLPNIFLPEQILQQELATRFETSDWKPAISINRLDDLFRSVLHKESIDQSWSSEHQLKGFFECRSDYIAVTKNEKYSTFLSKSEVFNELLKNLVVKRDSQK
jgi:hypothetical protein